MASNFPVAQNHATAAATKSPSGQTLPSGRRQFLAPAQILRLENRHAQDVAIFAIVEEFVAQPSFLGEAWLGEDTHGLSEHSQDKAPPRPRPPLAYRPLPRGLERGANPRISRACRSLPGTRRSLRCPNNAAAPSVLAPQHNSTPCRSPIATCLLPLRTPCRCAAHAVLEVDVEYTLQPSRPRHCRVPRDRGYLGLRASPALPPAHARRRHLGAPAVVKCQHTVVASAIHAWPWHVSRFSATAGRAM